MKELINSLGKDGLKSAYTLLEEFALYLTLALAVILTVTAVILYFVNKEKLKSFGRLALGIIIGYAITLSACISFLMVARMSIKGEIDKNFYLILGFFCTLLAYAIGLAIVSTMQKKAFKLFNIIGLILLGAYAVVLLLVLPTVDEAYKPLSFGGMYTATILLVAIIVVGAVFFDKSSTKKDSSKALSYAGICIALSFALSYVKLFSMPQGGSVTLASMLPLLIYSYAFGTRKGILAGVIYGVLQCLQNPQIYQPVQVLIDYPIAFASVGLAGCLKNVKLIKTPLLKFILGASIAILFRYASHFISGYYVFSSWAMEGYTALSWSLVYNLYLIAELLIVLFVGIFLFSSKTFVKTVDNLEK